MNVHQGDWCPYCNLELERLAAKAMKWGF
ncbi:MAG: hypothetical protein E6Q98_05275 [Rhodospirillaceae bacterium]|nr:MAG: hypothetical protein E6Q98_05275 [Rhodospirillaceae bacterium]